MMPSSKENRFCTGERESMDVSGDRLIEWREPQPTAFGRIAQCKRHRLHELDLFDDVLLAVLLHKYPRKLLQAFIMATDAAKRHNRGPVEIGTQGKCFFYLVCRRIGLDKARTTFKYEATYLVDPSAFSGIAPLREASRTAFAV